MIATLKTIPQKSLLVFLLVVFFLTAFFFCWQSFWLRTQLQTMQLKLLSDFSQNQNCVTNNVCVPTSVPIEKTESHYKTIDGVTYMVGPAHVDTNSKYLSFGTIDDSGSFTKYSPVNFEVYLDDSVHDFWFDLKNQSLILLQSLGQADGAAVEIFSKVSGSAQQRDYPLTYSVLFANQVIERYARSQIVDYDPESQQLIVLTMGGDACAGWGSVWKVNLPSAIKVNISQVSSGCHDENPRFAGFINDKLYFVSAKSEFIEPGQYYTRDTIQEIFTIDPETLHRETISADLTQLNGLTAVWSLHKDMQEEKFTDLQPTELLLAKFSKSEAEYFGYDIFSTTLRKLQ